MSSNTSNDLFRQIQPYVQPTCSVLAAVGFFIGGQARLAPLFSNKKLDTTQDNNGDDGLIPLLKNLGLNFSSSNASAIIGTIKMALTVGILYEPSRQTTARWGLAYSALCLVSRFNQGIPPTPTLISMALLSVPAQIFSSNNTIL